MLDTSSGAGVLLLLLLLFWTACYRFCMFASSGATKIVHSSQQNILLTVCDSDGSKQVEGNTFLKYLLYSNPLEKINSLADLLTTHQKEMLCYFREDLYAHKVKLTIKMQLEIQIL